MRGVMRSKRNGFTTRILREDRGYRTWELRRRDSIYRVQGSGVGSHVASPPYPLGHDKSDPYDLPIKLKGKGSRATLFRVLLCGCILELLYLVIVALAPLPDLHLSSSPLVTAWPWTLVPSHLLFPGAWASGSSSSISSPNNWTHLVLLTLTLIAATSVFAGAGWSILRLQNNNSATTRWLLLLLSGATLFCLTLLVQPALFSHT